MSISSDDLPSVEQPEERSPTSSRQPNISYTREYLLSLSELEICKRLPEGFDESLLSEFGSLPQQGFRRNDYGSSPPGKGETGNFSRGVQRWDSRSSWRSDSDSQSDRGSDSGRRYGNQFRPSLQTPEHDGLLGSGSFPKPSGNGPGSSVPRAGVNDQHQVNRSNDPYHPSGPYKAVPRSWRETKDSFNDETFGLDEDTNVDRVEEERKRRAEFEMMRKEQQKELKERLKLKAMGKLKNDPLTEMAAALDSGDNATMTTGLDISLVKPIHLNDSSKVSFLSQGHPSRPLVPPGFANAGTENISGPKSFGSPLLEVGKLEAGGDNQENKSALQPNLDEKHCETAFPWASEGGKKVDLSSAFESSSKVKDPDDQSLGAANILGISKILDNDKVKEIKSENSSGQKIVGEAGHSTSVFEKFFEGALSIQSTSPSNIIEDHNMKTHIDLSPKDFHSSKFAQWFLKEEKKPMESGSSEKPNALLSLIAGEKSELIASEMKTIQQILPPESKFVKMDTLAPSDAGASDSLFKNRPERISAVLTCEDLEQSILLDIGGSSPRSQPPGIICSQHGLENEIPVAGLENEIPVAGVNSNASQHLLSLIQKGIGSNSKTASPISMLDKGSPKEPQDMDYERKNRGHLRNLNAENLSSEKGLTLETLFGTSFMKELQSFDAPTTVQRNSAEPSSIDVSEPSMLPVAMSDDGAVYTSVSEARFRRINKDDSISGLGREHQTNLEKGGMNWLTVDSTQTDVESSNSQRFDRQDSLPFSHSRPVNAGRQDSSPFSHGPFDMSMLEIPFPSMHAQSPPQFNPTLRNHGMPIFPPLDPHGSHINPQFNFMPLEGITHQDAAIHHQISANQGHLPFRHPNLGPYEFDHPIHPMLQQMHMPKIPPPAPHLPGFPGGAPPPPHHGGNPPGYPRDHNLPRGFPFGQQQPNLVDLRVPLQGPEHGRLDNNPPQTFQRLIEMELRSNQKQMHPSFPAVGGHSRPMHGHEMDTGFWYR